MKQLIPTTPVLSPLNGKPILMNFDGAEMSSDAGLTLLREVERRHVILQVCWRPASRTYAMLARSGTAWKT